MGNQPVLAKQRTGRSCPDRSALSSSQLVLRGRQLSLLGAQRGVSLVQLRAEPGSLQLSSVGARCCSFLVL